MKNACIVELFGGMHAYFQNYLKNINARNLMNYIQTWMPAAHSIETQGLTVSLETSTEGSLRHHSWPWFEAVNIRIFFIHISSLWLHNLESHLQFCEKYDNLVPNGCLFTVINFKCAHHLSVDHFPQEEKGAPCTVIPWMQAQRTALMSQSRVLNSVHFRTPRPAT